MKETLKEAAEKYADIYMDKFDLVSSDKLPYFHNDRHKIEDAFESGAKWQSEKMHSEEEVVNLIQFLSMNQNFNDYSSVSKETAKYFIEQFKNK